MTIATKATPARPSTVSVPGARRLLVWTGIAALCAWVLVPIYLVALGAFGGRLGVFRWPKSLWPTDLAIAPMMQFLNIEGVFNALGNSFIAAGLTVVFSVLLGAPAGYALARYSFKGQTAFRLLILLTRAFPLAILALPLTVSFIRLGLYDTAFGVVPHPHGSRPALRGARDAEPLHGDPARTTRKRPGCSAARASRRS